MSTAFDRQQEQHWAERTNLRAHDHPVVRLFAQQRVAFLRSLLGAQRFESALDVGCGDGFGMSSMQQLVAPIHGCDRSRRMLAANPAPRDALVRCDAHALPWSRGAYDLVYCWELLHHIGEPQRVVDEMRRVARRAVLLCEPNCLNPAMAAFELLVPAERGGLRFTPGYTSRLLRRAGLKRIRAYTVAAFTPNRTPAALARVLSRLPYRVPLVGMYTIAVGELGPGR